MNQSSCHDETLTLYRSCMATLILHHSCKISYCGCRTLVRSMYTLVIKDLFVVNGISALS
jgi:hypothetical protein